ncbi:MAG: glycosyltransferase family 2 protein [Nanoarchaeota archaeon]
MGCDDTYIVIPAKNEGGKIAGIINKTRQFSKKIIVVDDGSEDNTSMIAEKEGVIVLKHIINLGKGAALKTGCDYALKKNAKIIVTMDADGQHDPKDIIKFKEKIKHYHIVIGYRKLNKNMPFILKYGNYFINTVTRLLYNLNLHDTQCGFRAFTAAAYKKIRWKATDYSMESEMLANAGKYHLRYAQVPIETIYTDKYKGTTVLDGMKIVFNMFLWKIKR